MRKKPYSKKDRKRNLRKRKERENESIQKGNTEKKRKGHTNQTDSDARPPLQRTAKQVERQRTGQESSKEQKTASSKRQEQKVFILV